MRAEPRVGGEQAIALCSLFLGVLGVAFSIRQPEASSLIFWAVIAVAFVLPAAMSNFSLARLIRRGPDPVLVASACRQVANAIDSLWMERRDWAPGPGAQPGGSRHEWANETKRLYDEGLRPWAIEVFDEAVACGALAASSRSLVKSPPVAQLHKLGDLFREAAETLERASSSAA